MKAKTELLLYRLLWLASKPMQPTFLNVSDSFEGWAYRNGLLAQIQRLEADGYLESRIDKRTGRKLHKLTDAGMRIARLGRDPEGAWTAAWDRKWRLFLFDIPESERSKRRSLTRALAAAGCGCLQASVWVSPHPPADLERFMASGAGDCSRLLLLHAESKGPAADKAMVAAAWNFSRINQSYGKYIERFAKPPITSFANAAALEKWTTEEAAAWSAVVRADPLLPDELLPSGYLGREAWQKRAGGLAKAAAAARKLALTGAGGSQSMSRP